MEPEFNVGEWVVTKDHGPYCSDIQYNMSGYKLPEIIYYTSSE